MEKNSENFSMQDAMRIAKSDAGKELLKTLQQEKQADLASMQKDAAAGNYEQLKASVQTLLTSDKVRALLEQIRRESNG